MTPETAAARVQAFLEAHALRPWPNGVIGWAVDNDHQEHQLTVSDLRELLAEVTR